MMFQGHIQCPYRQITQLLEADQDFCTKMRMSLNNLSFLLSQAARFVQDVLRNIQLYNVMKKS